MSWNSSTMIERNRSCSASLITVAVPEEIPGSQLQVLEIERRFAILGGGIGGRETGQQLLEQLAVAGGELLEGERVHGSCAHR